MNKFDQLDKLNDVTTEDKVVSVIEPKVEQQQQRLKKPTIFNALFATIKRDDKYRKSFLNGEKLPTYANTIFIVCSFAVLVLIGTLITIVLPALVSIPLALVFCPLVVPVVMTTLYYDNNVQKGIQPFSLTLIFVGGMISYVALRYLSDALLIKIILEGQLETYFLPIISTIITFVICFFIATTNKTAGISQCFLIAMAFSMGTVFAEQLIKGFHRLFLTESLTLSELQTPIVELIVNDEKYLKRSLLSLFNGWLGNYLVYPFLNACWASIIGLVVSMTTEFKDNRRDMPRSLYLLLILAIIFRILYLIDTSISYVDVALRLVSFAGSLFIAIKLINYTLNQQS